MESKTSYGGPPQPASLPALSLRPARAGYHRPERSNRWLGYRYQPLWRRRHRPRARSPRRKSDSGTSPGPRPGQLVAERRGAPPGRRHAWPGVAECERRAATHHPPHVQSPSLRLTTASVFPLAAAYPAAFPSPFPDAAFAPSVSCAFACDPAARSTGRRWSAWHRAWRRPELSGLPNASSAPCDASSPCLPSSPPWLADAAASSAAGAPRASRGWGSSLPAGPPRRERLAGCCFGLVDLMMASLAPATSR